MQYQIAITTFCALLFAHSSLASAQISLGLGDVSAPVGSVVAMPLSIGATNGDVSSLVLNLAFDPTQVSVAGVSLDGAISGLGKALQYRAEEGGLRLSVFGGTSPLVVGKIGVLYWKLGKGVGSGGTVSIVEGGSNASSPEAAAVGVLISGGGILVTTLPGMHSADYAADWTLSLSELLRIIQFFNSDGLHCDSVGEDGYNPGGGDTSCSNHNSDYNLVDWAINLSELLRAIQFYNSMGSAYHPDPAGEDKFSPGPFGE